MLRWSHLSSPAFSVNDPAHLHNDEARWFWGKVSVPGMKACVWDLCPSAGPPEG